VLVVKKDLPAAGQSQFRAYILL